MSLSGAAFILRFSAICTPISLVLPWRRVIFRSWNFVHCRIRTMIIFEVSLFRGSLFIRSLPATALMLQVLVATKASQLQARSIITAGGSAFPKFRRSSLLHWSGRHVMVFSSPQSWALIGARRSLRKLSKSRSILKQNHLSPLVLLRLFVHYSNIVIDPKICQVIRFLRTILFISTNWFILFVVLFLLISYPITTIHLIIMLIPIKISIPFPRLKI